MGERPSKLKGLIVGDQEPNQAQLKFYSSIAGDLAKTIVLASGAILIYPFDEDVVRLTFAIAGLFTSTVLFVSASRMLKEVRDT